MTMTIKNIFYQIWILLPERFRNKFDIGRRVNFWKSTGVVFIHVPKVAGVSISHVIYGRPLGHFYASQIRNVIGKEYDDMFSFGFVRNPIARLYSAYKFAVNGGGEIMKIHNPEFYRAPYFESFERFVTDWLVYQDVYKLDGVFRPQFLYLCENKKVIVNAVYKLEEMHFAEQELSEVMKRPIRIGHLNKSFGPNVPDLSPEIIKIVKDIYIDDYEIFGYT